MSENEAKPGTIFGMPIMSVIFDGLLTVALTKGIFIMGGIQERLDTLARVQTEQAARVQSIEVINNSQAVSIGQTDAHYADIIRRLDDLQQEVRKRR